MLPVEKERGIPEKQGRSATRVSRDDAIKVGQWYIVKDKGRSGDWPGCVIRIGSNYIELRGPMEYYAGGHHQARVHIDEFDDVCELVGDPERMISGKIKYFESRVRQGLNEIRLLTSGLGIDPTGDGPDPGSKSVMVIAGATDIEAYKSSLSHAKKRIPEIHAEIKKETEGMNSWLGARKITLEAQIGGTRDAIELIENKIFSVSLYAGLREDIEHIVEGAPAPENERLRLMQRRLYMDEECLLDYEVGGMEYREISEFDRWLSKSDNFKRILPFPKSMVAFRVRRFDKYRDWTGDLSTALINIRLAEEDKATFFYIRNGENLYRLDSALDFGEMIFPDQDRLNLTEPMMIEGRGRRLITRREYERMKAEYEEEEEAKREEDGGRSPWFVHRFSVEEYQPFDSGSLYYDDMVLNIGRQVDHYNRIVLIVQGLFDRTNILDPHPRVKTWDDESFRSSIELIYDASNVLYGTSDPPSFREYQRKCNASLKAGSMTVGQELWWRRQCEEKTSGAYFTGWPRNPGPGYIAPVKKYIRTGKAVFEWKREKVGSYHSYGGNGKVNCKITIPAEYLFNINAYKPGDYKQFFRDPRTRERYLKWAQMLLAAEEHVSGGQK